MGPHFLQHSGFRLVSSENEIPAGRVGSKTPQSKNSLSPSLSAVGGSGAAKEAMENNQSVYELDTLVSQYLGLHFPASGEDEGTSAILPHSYAPEHALRFPQRCAQVAHK